MSSYFSVQCKSLGGKTTLSALCPAGRRPRATVWISAIFVSGPAH